uniref:Uncharacterized protein n=1 Tax=Rhizophora mucronata TaxID=61149 RepID=A0A2P2NH86_RHIMU
MVSGSPVENMEERKEPRSEDRKWMVRRRIMGKRRRPSGLKRSEMASVMASWSPTRVGASTTMNTTAASRIPWGGPRRCCLSSNIFCLIFRFLFPPGFVPVISLSATRFLKLLLSSWIVWLWVGGLRKEAGKNGEK